MPDQVTPPAKPITDPLMQRFLGNLNIDLNPAGDLIPLSKEGLQAHEKAVAETVTEKPPETPAAPVTPPVEPPVVPPVEPAAPVVPPVVEPPATPPVTPPAEIPIVPSRIDEVAEMTRKIQADLEAINQRSQTPAPPVVPQVVTPPAVNPDEEYDKTLPEEAKEVLEVLQWADSKPEYKGKAGEYRSYLKKLDGFLKDNPEAEASEIETFKRSNDPKITGIRGLSKEKIKAEAKAEFKQEYAATQNAELESVKKRQYEMEIKPVLAEAEKEFANRFTEVKEGSSLDPEAAKAILSNAPEVAEKYALEAPIVKRHIELASEYLKIRTGITPFNGQNPVHSQLLNFVARHEQAILAGPEAGKLRDGKRFATNAQLDQLLRADPQAESKYWTLNENDVRSRLEKNAHLVITSERKKVEDYAKKMGYTKVPVTPAPANIANKTETPPAAPAVVAPPVTPPEASPIAGASRAPGAGKPAQQASTFNDAMKNLFPGMENIQ